jgi:hypothetical protein
MAFLSGIHVLTGWHCKLRPNPEGTLPPASNARCWIPISCSIPLKTKRSCKPEEEEEEEEGREEEGLR